MCVGSDSVEGHQADHEHKTYRDTKIIWTSQSDESEDVTFRQTVQVDHYTSLTLLIMKFTSSRPCYINVPVDHYLYQTEYL